MVTESRGKWSQEGGKWRSMEVGTGVWSEVRSRGVRRRDYRSWIREWGVELMGN